MKGALALSLLLAGGCEEKSVTHDKPIEAPEFRVVDKRATLSEGRCIVRLAAEGGDIDLETARGDGCDTVPNCVAIYKGLAEGPMLPCKGAK